MNNKKVISMFVVMTLIGGAAGIAAYRSFNSDDGIKILEYKSSSSSNMSSNENNIVVKDSYQISKIENLNGVLLINDKEILNLKSNGKYNEFSGSEYYTCSIYNTETKEEKDFKNISIDNGKIFGLSPNRRYLLYSEGKDTSSFKEMTEEEYMNNGGNKSKIKILDLSTGEIKDFGTKEYENNIDFRWISDDKIIYSVTTSSEWIIADITGKECMKGVINGIRSILDVNEAKDLGNRVEGDLYYYRYAKNSDGKNVCIIEKYNLSTKKITKIKETNEDSSLRMSGGVIGETLIGTEINYINTDGDTQKRISSNSKTGTCYPTVISKDGSKGAYIYSKDPTTEKSTGLNIIDIKSGALKEIAKIKDFVNTDLQNDYLLEYMFSGEKGERIESKQSGYVFKMGTSTRTDLAWSNDDKSFIFTYHYNLKSDGKNHVDSYIVKFE